MQTNKYPGFVRHDANTEGRTFVAGDLHGQYDALMAELDRVSFDRQRDVLYHVGDLIDRGSDSFKCLSLPFQSWFRGCVGNHEELAMNALRLGSGVFWDLWIANGGNWINDQDAGKVKHIMDQVRYHLPLAREFVVGDYRFGIVHADPPWDWHQVTVNPQAFREQLTWGRDRIEGNDTSGVEGIDAVFVGHTIVDQPVWLGNVGHIDTGAFTQNGHLTLLDLDELVERREATGVFTTPY